MSSNILAEAKRLRNDCKEEYAHNVEKTSKYKNAHGKYVHFEKGDPKCNYQFLISNSKFLNYSYLF